MELFKSWINNPKRDYLTGLALYNKYKRTTKHDAFLNIAKPSQLHVNMLYSLTCKLFHILKTTGAFEKSIEEIIPVAPQVKPIQLTKNDNTNSPSIDAENPMNHRSDKNYVNKLLSLEYSKLSFEDKLIFNNSEKYFLEKKQSFISNSDIDREMRGIHAKLKVIDPDPKFDHDREALILDLDRLEKQKTANWKTVDTWEDPVAELTDAALIAKQTLDNQRRIRANNVYINRTLKKLKYIPVLTAKQKGKAQIMRDQITERKKELVKLGSPFKEKS